MTTIVEKDENLKHKFVTEPMTIRDQFALAAMQILLTNFHGFKEEDRIAQAAYYQADCMMKARKE